MTDRTVVTDAAEANAAAAALGQPPTARRVEHSGLWPYSLVTTRAQRELAAEVFKIGQQACFDQASVSLCMWAGSERTRDDSLQRVHTST
jgi:hypothetical protein